MANANKEPTSSGSDDPLSGDYYGMVWLGLANAAYTSDWKHDLGEMTADLKVAIENPKYMPLLPEEGHAGQTGAPTRPGSWSLDWGPAISPDWSNLAYVASYRSGENGAGDPQFFVVSIRGTDTSTGFNGLIDQVIQDLRSFAVRPWSTYLDTGVDIPDGPNRTKHIGPPPRIRKDAPNIEGNVAIGTIEGFNKIAGQGGALQRETTQHGTGDVLTLVEALDSLRKCANLPIIVTGHSLGGCQTQVMTSYLAWQFPECSVIGQPFAPSTAGDEQFAQQAAFSTGCFWWCTLDFIPCGYGPVSDYALGGEFYKDNLAISWAIENQWTESRWPGTEEAGPHLPEKELLAGARDLGGGKIEGLKFRRPTLAGMADKRLEGELPPFEVMREFLIAIGKPATDEDLRKPINQLIWQHFPPNYKLMLWERCQSDLVHFDFVTYDTKPHHP
ncbi:lipase family protein [Nisaea sp.]|uniref:lipase family protein n=1 Tax=Nisaea sp. TaxID=2024842 RepID=UPI003B522630